jgi:hypothetical protein
MCFRRGEAKITMRGEGDVNSVADLDVKYFIVVETRAIQNNVR